MLFSPWESIYKGFHILSSLKWTCTLIYNEMLAAVHWPDAAVILVPWKEK